MSDCYINNKVHNLSMKENAFMGGTHALSAVAVFLLVVAAFPSFFFQAIGTSIVWVLIIAMIDTSGASLLPDLDNTNSTSKSSLGLLGTLLTYFFRTTSAIIQTTIRTKRDDPNPSPHRGFYHTIPAALILGGLVYLGTQISGYASLPYLKINTYGGVFALIISWLLLHIALAGLLNKTIKSIKRKFKVFGELITFAISFSITYYLFYNLSDNTNYWWLSVSFTFGFILHIIGDSFTTMGAPLFFPIPIKGKLWWMHRIMGFGIKAGGAWEKIIFIPLFLAIAIVSFIYILASYQF